MSNFKNVPLGDSSFQIQNFIAVGTPERKFRTCSLQLRKKQQALKECEFRRKRKLIDIEEIELKLKKAKGFEKRRLEIDLEEAQYGLESEVELIEDCIFEIKLYERILEDLPQVTRKDFEEAEYDYWKERLLRDAKHELASLGTVSKGTIDALEQIGIVVNRDNVGKLMFNEVKTKKDYKLITFEEEK